ncbi:hypothetical protein LTR16_001959 [Cryomyces antarcticus]|uniref:Uncharacterized protein n=1 Tax=Cryomyces antarcticus TaxID=329879 RepID=A0ABR0KTU4_9PEZI|nr:hypothetical protein LTR39_003904 [Cryomyces antarcticus]KAK5129756.1 hypothetical protein LTR16_001959 [Cryomyces antarcticus]
MIIAAYWSLMQYKRRISYNIGYSELAVVEKFDLVVAIYAMGIPPVSYVNPPLTPPTSDTSSFQVARVLRLFRSRQDGRLITKQPWTQIQLAPGEYEDIERRIEEDESFHAYVENKIRYDYDAHAQRITIRMPTTLHERFTAAVEEDIVGQLKTIGMGLGRAAQFARDVRDVRSSRIFLASDESRSSRSKREPDASFRHIDAEFPGVVVEVSYSQKREDLARLADDYLLGSDGSTRVLIGLDIEYRGSRKATVSMWRPQYIMNAEQEELRAVQTVQNEVFRNEDGAPSGNFDLRLHLKDFANEELAEDVGDQDREIIISSQQLCVYLADAERFEQGSRRSHSSRHTIRPGAVKRPRSETPPTSIDVVELKSRPSNSVISPLN